jgi:translocation and assembly module TamA
MTLRATCARALAAAALVVLAGCAGLPFGKPAAATAEAESVAQVAAYDLEIDAPAALRTLLERHLDLARFRESSAPGDITDVELDRLIGAAPAQVHALLETEGHFQSQVEITRSRDAQSRRLLRIAVSPGPQAQVVSMRLDVAGALETAAQGGDAAALDQRDALREAWPLQPGKAFTQAAWSDAKGSTLARLRAEGYPAAAWRDTHARVDAAAGTAALTAELDSGPLFRLGEIRIEGLQRYDEASVRRLATFAPGDPYSEQRLLDFQERLYKLELFEGAAVEIDVDPALAERVPVQVRVKEQPLQQATVGIGYSANTGPRLTLEHQHRRIFGTRWTASNKLELGPDQKRWQGDLKSHPLDGLYRDLVGGSAERLRTDADLRTSWSARVGRTQDTPRIERLYFLELVHARVESDGSIDDSNAVSANYHWIWRDLDSALLPTTGLSLSLQGAGGFARSSTDDSGPFGRAWGRLTLYRPLGASWYGTARVEAGQVFARDSVGVPDTLLFRAGGDESVRGYDYRTLGPLVDGVVASGRVVATASAEIARPIWADRPVFWWAAFVDAGNAANRWSRLKPALGYGLGLRWRSPVGPLRIDAAYGQDVKRLRLHLSVGIAF